MYFLSSPLLSFSIFKDEYTIVLYNISYVDALLSQAGLVVIYLQCNVFNCINLTCNQSPPTFSLVLVVLATIPCVYCINKNLSPNALRLVLKRFYTPRNSAHQNIQPINLCEGRRPGRKHTLFTASIFQNDWIQIWTPDLSSQLFNMPSKIGIHRNPIHSFA